MNGYRPSRMLMGLAQLLTIASTTSAVTLQDFQTITIIQVPSLSCLSAYGSGIHGCSRGDFQDGVQCSASCAEGIREDQAQVIAACKHVEVNSRSLLGLALQGGLLDALCPNFQATSVTSTMQPTTTRTFLTPSQTQETPTSITSTTESSSAITTPTSTSIKSLTTTTPSISSSVESSTTLRDTPSDIDTTVAGGTPTEAGGMTTIPSTSAPSPAQTSDGPGEQSNRGSLRGGGSPFDTVFIGGVARILPSVRMLVVLIGALLISFLTG
ncbi:hypothetical protein ANO14919_144180 [Xylariales sp. No.14919]|nr:hypothetical protein F5X98DRAFT_277993 [Xylaria grammica]GAW24824.1 hypothetical protein ANO14919_144180 [Xylariales sp. No.14919]